jgi:N-methylhydantoinase A
VIARAPLWVDGAFVEVPVYDRTRLAPGTALTGPLIIEQQDTTLVLGPQRLVVDATGSIVIEMNK